MGWIGKALGGAVGFALGGPMGMLGGATLGHLVDMGMGELTTPPRQSSQTGAATLRGRCPGCGAEIVVTGDGPWVCPECGTAVDYRDVSQISMDPEQRARLAFFVSTFSMFGKLAKADGKVSGEEINLVSSVMEGMRRDMGLSSEDLDIARQIFRAARTSPYSFGEFALQFRELHRAHPELLHAMLEILVRLALADRVLHPQELKMLQEAASIFGVPLRDLDQMLARHSGRSSREQGPGPRTRTPDPTTHYATLGVDPKASDEEVRAVYRKKIAEFHPDHLVSKGLPEEFIEFANKKTQELNEAWAAIKTARGL